jgi:hypothetical protein
LFSCGWAKAEARGTAVKAGDMIGATLTLPSPMTDSVTRTILRLPKLLRPTSFTLAEDEPDTDIGDVEVFLKNFKMPSIGVYLKNSNVEYDLRRSGPQTFVVDADFGMTPDDTVRDYLIHMAPLHPIFGFACAQEELEYRNRITTTFGINVMGSWVGRDPQKYIPGLFWWTLLPASLAEQHGVSLSVLMQAAQEHIELEGQQHLLRFYKKPEDWRSAASSMAELYHSCPGIFDVEKLPPKLQGKTNFLEITAILREWT